MKLKTAVDQTAVALFSYQLEPATIGPGQQLVQVRSGSTDEGRTRTLFVSLPMPCLMGFGNLLRWNHLPSLLSSLGTILLYHIYYILVGV